MVLSTLEWLRCVLSFSLIQLIVSPCRYLLVIALTFQSSKPNGIRTAYCVDCDYGREDRKTEWRPPYSLTVFLMVPFRHPRTHAWCWRKTYHHEQIWSLLSKIVVLKKGREGRRDDASTEREIDWLCATVPLVQFDVLCAKKNEFRTPVPRFQVTSSSISAWMSAP